MKKVAITGTIASGKSIMSDHLRSKGFEVFDSDKVAKQVYIKNTPEYKKIVKLLGKDILDKKGEVVFAKVSAIIFNNSVLREKLEHIIHPFVYRKMVEAAEGKDIFFAEVPLLFKTDWCSFFDEIVVVTCSKQIAKERCMRDRGYTEERFEERYAAQIDPAVQIERATKVFYNETTLDSFYKQIDEWIEEVYDGDQSQRHISH